MDFAEMTRIFQTLLKVKVLFYFEHHLRRRFEAGDSELPDDDLIELVIRKVDIGFEFYS
jgi:hypothetical protein